MNLQVMAAAFHDELSKIAADKAESGQLTGGQKALAFLAGGPGGYFGATRGAPHGRALEGGIRGAAGVGAGAALGGVGGLALARHLPQAAQIPVALGLEGLGAVGGYHAAMRGIPKQADMMSPDHAVVSPRDVAEEQGEQLPASEHRPEKKEEKPSAKEEKEASAISFRAFSREYQKIAQDLGGLDVVKLGEELTEAAKDKLPGKDFAVKADKSNTGHEAYPIPDRQHAASALGFAKMHHDSADLASVKKKIEQKYPDMLKDKK